MKRFGMELGQRLTPEQRENLYAQFHPAQATETPEGEVVPPFQPPDYFPRDPKMLSVLEKLHRDYWTKITTGGDTYHALQPSETPQMIFQQSYAVSEGPILSLGGIGPCVGVIMWSDENKRAIAVHLESRPDGDRSYLVSEAEKYLDPLFQALDGRAKKVVVSSQLLGVFDYHDIVQQCVQKVADSPQSIMNVTSPFVHIDPSTGTIRKTWNAPNT